MPADSIKVIVRVRPFKENQINANQEKIIDMDGQSVYITNPDQPQEEPKQFGFHRCYWSFDDSKDVRITNKQIFKDIGREVLDQMYSGYNATIFAYGQTGSGKSCSIEGVPGIEPKGLLQLCLEDVFEKKQENDKQGIKTTIKATYMEIYNEKLKNLLDHKNSQIDMKQFGTSVKFFVEANGKKAELKPELCETYDSVYKVFETGKSFRVVGATDMNKSSSRSHAIFTVFYHQKGPAHERSAKLNIVDLAGSERLERTGAQGDRAKEGTAINKSLSALGRVIGILADNCTKGRKDFVPYRESVLTQILAESLGGNSKTFLIAALSPAGFNYDETLSTLRFAQNASKISLQVKKDEKIKGTDKDLQREIERLRKELEEAKNSQKVIPAEVQPVYMNNMEVIQIEDQNKALFLESEIERLKDAMKSKEEIEKELEEERRLKKELEKSRDEALKKAGVSMAGAVSEEDSKLPYIINISDDPTIAGILIYRLREQDTKIGTGEVEDNNIKLNSLGINKRHCSIVKEGEDFYIIPKTESKVFVNGIQVKEKEKIKHLDRIVLGHANKFKMVIPGAKVEDEDEIRKTNQLQDTYGEFLGDRLNADNDESKNMKKLIKSMQTSLSNNAFYRFLENLKDIYSDVDEANQYTLERYRKFPTRGRNVEFNFNFMVNIKGQAEVIILCNHKETGEVLFVWNEEKFKTRLAEMEEWWSESKNPEKSYEEFDPWFDATDGFIKEKEKLDIMTLKQMREFYSHKQDQLQEKVKALNTEQTEILNAFIEHFEPGITKQGLEDYCEQYCDYYFRQDEKFIDKQKLEKIEELRKNEEIHKKMKRWMETITEFEAARKENDRCNNLRKKYAQKKSKKDGHDDDDHPGGAGDIKLKEENEKLRREVEALKKNSVGGSGDSDMVQKQYAQIEMLQEELKRRALQMKKLKG